MAAPALGLAAVLTLMVDWLISHEIWLGPVYLLVAACASWFVGYRYAIALGLIILSVNWMTGGQSAYPYGPHSLFLNITVKFLCVLAIALMLDWARKSLEKEWLLARTDPLTGALNRQAFFEAIKAESDRRLPAVLIFADLDGLKRLNDQSGHERGDDSLREFADRVRKAIRKNDIFARIGGDEFVIFMNVTDEGSVRKVANRLNHVLNLAPDLDGATLKCSLGVLFLPAGSKSIDAELKLADKLMYSAKRVQAGFLMATAIQPEGQRTLVSALEAALPANGKSVVRQTDGEVTAALGSDLAVCDGLLADTVVVQSGELGLAPVFVTAKSPSSTEFNR